MTDAKRERERDDKSSIKEYNEHDYLNKMEGRINDLMLVFCKSNCVK